LPLHLLSETTRLKIEVAVREIPTDVSDIAYSDWSIRLTNPAGETWVRSWSVRRWWQEQRVVAESHFAHHEQDDPFPLIDPLVRNPRGYLLQN
jgi:hypothetical protein